MKSKSFNEIQQEIAKEKQASRDADEKAIESGEKTKEQIQKENGIFSFPNAKIVFEGII